jgi:hypothetical protein
MRTFIVEHKTTSEDIGSESDYWKRLRLDPQVSTYMVGARALGIEPDECLYDVARKPMLRPSAVPVTDADGVKVVRDAAGQRVRTKDGKKWRETSDSAQGYVLETRPETPEEFRIRLRESIAEAPDKYYGRGHIVRLEEDERDAAHDTWQTALAIRNAETTKRWPRNPDACVRYGRTCEFFPVCTRETIATDPTRYVRKPAQHSELDGDGKVHLPLVTTSSMRTFRRCAREYQLSYVENLASVEKAEALRFGTMFHRGLEVWWRTVDIDAALAAMAGDAIDDFERAKAEEMMRGYHYRWRNEPFDVLAVEQQFVTPLVNPATGASSRTYELGGKIDAVARLSEAAE